MCKYNEIETRVNLGAYKNAPLSQIMNTFEHLDHKQKKPYGFEYKETK